jgi:alcohol dehydrogenase (NADP+)
MGTRSVTLSSGQQMPLLGLGTWQAPKGEVGAAVTTALAAGYRHIDCAAIYGNEGEVGEALAAAFAGGLARKDVFVTSKLWNSEKAPADVKPALLKTLADLKLGYLDLYLIHWPQQFGKTAGVINTVPRNEDNSVKYAAVPILDTWRALEALVEEGLVRALGVSNFNAAQVNALCDAAKVQPVCNQVESHPFFAQAPLLAACRTRGVALSAYSPLGSGASVDGHSVRAARSRAARRPPPAAHAPAAGRALLDVLSSAGRWRRTRPSRRSARSTASRRRRRRSPRSAARGRPREPPPMRGRWRSPSRWRAACPLSPSR